MKFMKEQSSSISLDDDSITSSEMNVPRIIIPRVLHKLVEFDEVSSEIRNADSKYGNHLPPLPLRLASAPEIEHMPPITRHNEDGDCMAPGQQRAAFNSDRLPATIGWRL